jgi:hypothetical protein
MASVYFSHISQVYLMVDMVFFSLCSLGILILMILRYLYAKSLTGISMGGDVGASYWGNYQSSQPSQGGTFELPKYAKGVCPACQKLSHTIQCHHEFNK